VLFGRAILPLTPLWERDHPIALVPFFKASDLCREEGCERLPSREALRHFDARDRQASWQIRQFVADARLGNFDLSRMDDYEVLDVIRDALRDGRLIAVQKGAGKSDSPSATVGLRRLVVQVEKATRGKLSYGGRQYKLVVDLDLGRVPGRDYYEVASQSEARAVLDSAASEQGASADLLKKASEKLTKDWRPPFQPDGLILLRRIRQSSAPVKDTEPAMTPSQMKAMMEKDSAEEPTIRLVNVEAPTFVPGAETIRLSYAIDGPVAKADAVVMIVKSVPAKGDRAMVESLAVPGPYAASGEVNWDGKAATEGGFITLKGSPYEVTFELTSKSGAKSKSSPGKLRIDVKDIKIVVDDKGPLDVADQWKTTVGALVDELKKSGMPGDCEGRVVLDSPAFKASRRDGKSDMDDATSFLEYKNAVAVGPAIPFLARIALKSKSGEGKRSAPVLIGTRLLWDFKLESSADLDGSLSGRGMHAAAKTFVKKAASFEETVTQPKGTSAHLKVGGFRTKSSDRATVGIQWTSGDEWNMTAPKERDWAAFTECGDGADDSVDSAVYFRLGRMAGDAHKVRAVVDVDESLDVKDEAAPEGAPTAHRSNTIKLVTWRRIPIVATWIVGTTTTPISTAPLTAEYKKAALLIEPGPGVAPQDIGAKWATEYKTVADGYVKAKDPFLGKALESDPQGYPVRFRDFMDYWDLANPDAGFFGDLWERIKNFFGADDEQKYKKKCDDAWYGVLADVALRIPIPDKGITAVKFGQNGPHNQNPDEGSFTAGVAPSIDGLTDRNKAIFFQFTVSDDAKTFIHEVGHTLFLAHAPGHFTPGKQPAGFQPNAHDKDQVCLMSYSSRKRFLCGLCFVKLAGWNYLQVNNDGSVKP
jgi:hypothetical protein